MRCRDGGAAPALYKQQGLSGVSFPGQVNLALCHDCSYTEPVVPLVNDPEHRISVVGIAASAGGVEALQAFFEAVPPDLGPAYVVVHLSPHHESELAQIPSARRRCRCSRWPMTRSSRWRGTRSMSSPRTAS